MIFFSLSLTFLQYIYNSMAIVEMIYGPRGIRYFGVNLGDTTIIRPLLLEYKWEMHADENVHQYRGLKSKFMNLRIVIDGILVEKRKLLLMQKISKRPKSDRCFRIFIFVVSQVPIQDNVQPKSFHNYGLLF